MASAKIGESSLHHPVVVHSVVLKEAPIFNRDDRINQDLWHVVVSDKPLFCATLAIKETGDKLRFKLVSVESASTLLSDTVDFASAYVDGGGLRGVVGLRAGMNLDVVFAFFVSTDLRLAAIATLGVSGPAQFGGDRA